MTGASRSRLPRLRSVRCRWPLRCCSRAIDAFVCCCRWSASQRNHDVLVELIKSFRLISCLLILEIFQAICFVEVFCVWFLEEFLSRVALAIVPPPQAPLSAFSGGTCWFFLVVFACHSSRFVTLLLHFRLKKVSGLCCIIVGGGRP